MSFTYRLRYFEWFQELSRLNLEIGAPRRRGRRSTVGYKKLYQLSKMRNCYCVSGFSDFEMRVILRFRTISPGNGKI